MTSTRDRSRSPRRSPRRRRSRSASPGRQRRRGSPGRGGRRSRDRSRSRSREALPREPPQPQRSKWPSPPRFPHSERPVGGPSGRAAGPRPEPRPGDWACPTCDYNCFASRDMCNRCGTARPPGAGGGFGGRGPGRRGDGGDDSQMQWGKGEDALQQEPLPEKDPEPDFGLSGALAAETNTVNGIVLLHNEPPEARKPGQRWRLYVFKDGQPHGEPLHIHRQSRYLFGRERRVADVPTDHPSCSKQHAVLQFRMTEKEGGDGMMVAAVRPYLLDLGSTNGTWLNGERLEAQRYYELMEKDMVKFGTSSREYVLLKES